MNLAGTLELSHLHIAGRLNLIIHSTKAEFWGFIITTATSYSVAPLADATRLVIGDQLPLQLEIRWYDGIHLPSSDFMVHGDDVSLQIRKNVPQGSGTLFWCFCTGVSVALTMCAFFYGWDLPKRLQKNTRLLPLYGGTASASSAWFAKSD